MKRRRVEYMVKKKLTSGTADGQQSVNPSDNGSDIPDILEGVTFLAVFTDEL